MAWHGAIVWRGVAGYGTRRCRGQDGGQLAARALQPFNRTHRRVKRVLSSCSVTTDLVCIRVMHPRLCIPILATASVHRRVKRTSCLHAVLGRVASLTWWTRSPAPHTGLSRAGGYRFATVQLCHVLTNMHRRPCASLPAAARAAADEAARAAAERSERAAREEEEEARKRAAHEAERKAKEEKMRQVGGGGLWETMCLGAGGRQGRPGRRRVSQERTFRSCATKGTPQNLPSAGTMEASIQTRQAVLRICEDVRVNSGG